MIKNYAGNNAELLDRAAEGDEVAKNELVEQNLGLVHSIVKRFIGRGTDAEDLFQIGCIGLISAVNRFDKSFGVTFSTYAVPVIIGEIKRFLRDDGIVKVSRSLKETAAKATYLREKIIKKTGKEPSITELASELKVDVCFLSEALDSQLQPKSIYQTADNGDKTQSTLADTISCNDDPIGDMLDRVLLHQAAKILSERERKIIYLRYFKRKTQSQVSEKMGISQVQVSRLEKKILTKLREIIGD